MRLYRIHVKTPGQPESWGYSWYPDPESSGARMDVLAEQGTHARLDSVELAATESFVCVFLNQANYQGIEGDEIRRVGP